MLCFVAMFGVFCGCVWCVLWLCLVCYGCICGIVGYPVLVCLCFWCVGCIMYNDKDILASCCVLWLCLVCFVVVFGVLWLYLRYSRISCFVCLCFWCVGCIMIRISWHRAPR